MPTSPATRRRADPGGGSDRLRAYAFHGVELTARGSHAVGDCPFCGHEGKFSAAADTGLWRCWSCGGGTPNGGGNPLMFLRCLHERLRAALGAAGGAVGANGYLGRPDAAANGVGPGNGIPGRFHAAVAADRRLLDPGTVAAWGVCRATDGAWVVPGYGTDGQLTQLYRRAWMGGAWRLLPTPGVWTEGKVHALHLPADDFDPAGESVDVCEGLWDGMVLWEAARGSSLLPTTVVAVPGCSVWRDEWTELCRGKRVRLWFDSDHPPTLGGYNGMRRAVRRLAGTAASVKWLRWGPDGYDPGKPSGYDVRDYLTEERCL